MILYLFAILAPGAIAFFGALQFAQAIEHNTSIASKVLLLLLTASMLWNMYLLTSLYF